jgi:type IV secretory pathway VirB3-like protein
MANVREFSYPVHRSMRVRSMILGVPPIAFALIMVLTVLMVYRLGQIWFLAITMILWFAARQIAKKDQWLLDIILVSLKQKDYYTP